MNDAFDNADVSCPICFEEYTGDPRHVLVGYVLHCGHYFHFECIWKWLENNPNCPLCREDVLLKEDSIKGITLDEVVILEKEHKKRLEEKDIQQYCHTEKSRDNPQAPPISLTMFTATEEEEILPPPPPLTRETSLSVSVINIETNDIREGTIAAGAAFPGCGTHELDLRSASPLGNTMLEY